MGLTNKYPERVVQLLLTGTKESALSLAIGLTDLTVVFMQVPEK